MEIKIHRKSLPEINAWVEKLHELEATAMCGTPISDEEYEQRLQSVIDGSCFAKYLDKVLKQKQEIQTKLAAIEKTEQMLRAKIAANLK